MALLKIVALNWDSACHDMEVIKKKITENEEQEWEDPLNPENPSDERDKEQIVRQYKEAKRRKDNLTEKDHIDKEPKTD